MLFLLSSKPKCVHKFYLAICRVNFKNKIANTIGTFLMDCFCSIKEAVSKKDCIWTWEEVSLDEANNLKIDDFKDKNIRIGTYVMDLPAIKFFQHLVTI